MSTFLKSYFVGVIVSYNINPNINNNKLYHILTSRGMNSNYYYFVSVIHKTHDLNMHWLSYPIFPNACSIMMTSISERWRY